MAVKTTNRQGILSCLKHFPGLGAASIDPHEATATADYDELVWRQREKIPFAAGVEEGADMVMTTHLFIPKMDDNMVLTSSKIVSNLLREELQFDGPVITDDLCMQGAAGAGNIGERAVKAFNAGHDLLLFGPDHGEAIRAYDYFVDAVRRGEITKENLRGSLDRVAGLKFKLEQTAVR
jgi:beta-N-acetylhexosaminidase